VAHFNDVDTLRYNSAESEWIWMKFGALRVYCLELALADFGHDPHISESKRARRFFGFFWSGEQRTISPTSGRPNIVKFARKTWIYVAMNPFGKHFCGHSTQYSHLFLYVCVKPWFDVKIKLWNHL